MDESGDHISEYDHDVYKERLDSSGRSILKEKSEGKKGLCRENLNEFSNQ